ncbi:hypothetical protein QTN25_006314 [Entamoeba marina]
MEPAVHVIDCDEIFEDCICDINKNVIDSFTKDKRKEDDYSIKVKSSKEKQTYVNDKDLINKRKETSKPKENVPYCQIRRSYDQNGKENECKVYYNEIDYPAIKKPKKLNQFGVISRKKLNPNRDKHMEKVITNLNSTKSRLEVTKKLKTK